MKTTTPNLLENEEAPVNAPMAFLHAIALIPALQLLTSHLIMDLVDSAPMANKVVEDESSRSSLSSISHTIFIVQEIFPCNAQTTHNVGLLTSMKWLEDYNIYDKFIYRVSYKAS